MTTEQVVERPDEPTRDQQRHALLGKHVLHALGEPERLYAVQVRPLWEDHYRVNVFVTVADASVVISDSFFLVTDPHGNVLASMPEIVRQY